jgi:hypothetical protein
MKRSEATYPLSAREPIVAGRSTLVGRPSSRFAGVMSDLLPIVADRLRVHGHLDQHELDVLIDRWAKLDQRLQSFIERSIDIDLHVYERDT